MLRQAVSILQNKVIRLDKYLAHAQVGTRSNVKKTIQKGFVHVNGKICKQSNTKIKKDDVVQVDGINVVYEEFSYLVMNKPKNVLSATRDGATKTVIDLLDEQDRLRDVFPVGRLDKDTTGLIFLTDDGELAHKILHPKHHVDKLYVATFETPLDESSIKKFHDGIELADFTAKPAKLILSGDRMSADIIISEGKFHQIKRMVASCGSTVKTLHRQKLGPLVLDENLAEGAHRKLTNDEQIEILKLK